VWTAIAAKVDPDTGKPLLGAAPGKPVEGRRALYGLHRSDGAGHYVKMVHNGIEYGDMQMICEAYDLMQRLAGMSPAEIGQTFERWNNGVLDSYLVEITADVLQQTDPVTGEPFVDVVLDAAGQKGTGKWTSINALDMGVPAPTIAEAVFARCISAFKDERLEAAKILAGPESNPASSMDAEEDRGALLEAIHDALYCAKICSYAQGFELMRVAQTEYGWTLDLGEIAQIWRGGCIIRADFLQKITEAYRREPALTNLLLDRHFKEAIDAAQPHWRKVVALAAQHGVPTPTFAASLAYYDSYRSARLPQNLLQAQRDYFGAHTYERVDQPRGHFFHIDWPDPERPQRDS
jgi:6-phosphogluconate dehydrogenase